MNARANAVLAIDEQVAAAGGPEAVISRVATLAGWPDIDPLPECSDSRPQAFPFRGLGRLLGNAARCIARGVQAPDALAGGSVLASAALAAQAHADIVLPHGTSAPLSLFVVTGALSGDRKTATDSVASLPAEDHRRDQARQHAVDLAQFEQERAEKAKGEPEPTRPVARSLTVGKATVEGLHSLLRSQSHIGVFTGEGGELLGGHSLREERRSAGLAWFLKAWGAESIDTLTRGDGLSILLGRRLSLHAMVQPVLLRSLLVDPLAQGQGFLARCLVSEPETLAGTRLFRAGNPADSNEVRAYHSALRRLLAIPPVVNDFGDGHELKPRTLVLSAEATALWIEFYNQVEAEQAGGKALQGARAFASKAAEHAGRIAGIVEVVSNPNALEVGVETMAGAIEVASFYIGEHVRLTGAGVEDRHLAQLHALLEWMAERRSPVPNAEVLQATPRALRALKADGLRSLLEELAKRGYIRAVGKAWEVRR